MEAHSSTAPAAHQGVVSWRPQWVLLLLSCPILFYGLGSYSVVNGDEALYHYVARHMVQSGDWFRLVFAGQDRIYDTFTHAPLFLWFKAAIILVFGDSNWTMRVLSASLGLLSVLATYRLVSHLATTRAAFLAALVQLTTFQFVYLHSARTGEMETGLTLAFTLAAYFFLRAVEEGRSFVPHHLCLIALMSMKLAIVFIPLLAEFAFFLLHPGSRDRARAWFSTALLILPLGLLWHLYQAWAYWDELPVVLEALLYQVEGGGEGRVKNIGLVQQALYYGTRMVFGAYPFIVAYPLAIVAVTAAARRGLERERWILLLLYLAVTLAFFLALTVRHPWYLMPMIPLLSAFLGRALDLLALARPGLVWRVAIAVSLGLMVWIALPIFDFNPFAMRAGMVKRVLAWREVVGIGPWLGVPVSIGIFTLLLGGSGSDTQTRCDRTSHHRAAVPGRELARARSAPIRRPSIRCPATQRQARARPSRRA